MRVFGSIARRNTVPGDVFSAMEFVYDLSMPAGQYKKIYAVVRRIPRGRVATYGQIADIAGLPGHARQVGYALAALEDEAGVPWHRVVNAQGRISQRSEPGADGEQRVLLESEGVVFKANGAISLSLYRWMPRRRAR